MHPSPPTESKYRPSGEKRTAVMSSLWPLTRAIRSPEKKSKILSVLSKAHVAMYMPEMSYRIAYNVFQDVMSKQGMFRMRKINSWCKNLER